MNTEQINALKKAGLSDEAIARVLCLATAAVEEVTAPIFVEAPGRSHGEAPSFVDPSFTISHPDPAEVTDITPRWAVGTAVMWRHALLGDRAAWLTGEVAATRRDDDGTMMFSIATTDGEARWRSAQYIQDTYECRWPVGTAVMFRMSTSETYRVGAVVATDGDTDAHHCMYQIEVPGGERIWRTASFIKDVTTTVESERAANDAIAAELGEPVPAGNPVAAVSTADELRSYLDRTGDAEMTLVAFTARARNARNVVVLEAPAAVVQALDLPRRPRFVSTATHNFRQECSRRRVDGLLLTGNTYPAKEAIKAAGGIWDGTAQGWLMPDQETFDALTAYCATLTESMPLPRRSRASRNRRPRAPRPQNSGFSTIQQSPNGRCEDAPCCGCCE